MPKQGENISKAVLKARADWEAYTEKQLEHIYKIYEESAKRIDDVIRKYGKDNWRSDYLYGIKNSIKKEMAQLREKLKFQIQNGMKNSVDYGLKQGMRNAYELIGDERRIKLGTSYISKSGKIVKWDMRKDTVDTALWTKINRNALDSVIKFSENVSGLTFSENIWKELERTQRQIRKAIVKGLIEGRSPDQLSRDVRGFLHQPKKLFRRVRDKKGKLRLSKAAKEYKPGTGTYRSSYMNAMRLARTEYSRAYNEGIQRYAEKKDFIKGYIWRTGSGNPCPDCSDLNGTFFPKDAPPSLPEHPHCYSGDTEVYTNKGWQYFQDLKGDELILALNPNNFDLQYLPIKHQIEYPFKGKMISFKNRGFDLLVTTKHRMYVGKRSCAYDRKKKKFRFIEAEDLNGEYYIYRSSDWQGKNKKFIEIADKKIKTEVFCKFMGWYLSEGNSSKRKGFNSWQTVISQHGKKLKKMQKDLAKLPYKVNNFNGGVRIYDEQLGKYLRQFGKSNEKFIPEEIKELSSKYIRLFLDSYLAGDGNERKAKKWKNGKFKNEKVYFTASKKMADDIGELILKVGHRPSYYLQKSKGISKKHKNGTYIGNFDLWRIRECYRQYATKIRKSEEYYDGKVYDVELPKWHVLYVRRNGKCCWSGNCMCWLELVLKKG